MGNKRSIEMQACTASTLIAPTRIWLVQFLNSLFIDLCTLHWSFLRCFRSEHMFAIDRMLFDLGVLFLSVARLWDVTFPESTHQGVSSNMAISRLESSRFVLGTASIIGIVKGIVLRVVMLKYLKLHERWREIVRDHVFLTDRLLRLACKLCCPENIFIANYLASVR